MCIRGRHRNAVVRETLRDPDCTKKQRWQLVSLSSAPRWLQTVFLGARKQRQAGNRRHAIRKYRKRLPRCRFFASFRPRSFFTFETKVLSNLMGDKSFEKFRVEYEKLHRALKKSHDSEKRLMQRCRELNAEIVANASKVSQALKISQEDQNTITQLKKVRKGGRELKWKI